MTSTVSRADAARRAPGSIFILLIGTFMVVLDFFVVNVAIPDLQRDLHARDAEIELIIAGYAVAYASTLIVGSRLGDRFGRKRLFLVGTALFAAASALCGLAPNPDILVFGRLAQGFASGLLSPQVLSIFSAELDQTAKAHALVAYGFVMGLASVFAQSLGGALIRFNFLGIGWRICFLINVPVGLLSIALTLRFTPESRSAEAPTLDLIGMLLIFAALATLTLPLIEGRQYGWPLWSIELLPGSGILFAIFVWWESHVKHLRLVPLMDRALFRNRSFTVGLIAQFTFYMSMAGFYLVLALYLQEGRGLSPFAAGLIFIANGSGYLLTSSQAGRPVKRLGHQTIALAALLRALGLAVLLATVAMIGVAGPLGWLIPGLFLNGAGTGLAVSPLASTVLSRIDARHAGIASGILTTGLQVGNAMGVCLIGVIFFARANSALHPTYAPAFVDGLYYLIGLNLLVAIFVQLLRSEPAEQAERA